MKRATQASISSFFAPKQSSKPSSAALEPSEPVISDATVTPVKSVAAVREEESSTVQERPSKRRVITDEEDSEEEQCAPSVAPDAQTEPAPAASAAPAAPATAKSTSGSIPYASLVAVFEKIEATSKRLLIQEYLCSFLLDVITNHPDDLLSCLYLSCNKLAPAYKGVELGIGDSLLIKALSEASARQAKDIRADLVRVGDLGVLAGQSKGKQSVLARPKPLTVQSVYASFLALASEKGNKSMDKKVARIKGLLVACSGEEAKYVIRGLQGKLRIGLAETTVVMSLAHAFAKVPELNQKTISPAGGDLTDGPMTPEQCEAVLRHVLCELPSFDVVVPVLLAGGVAEARARCQLTPGIPVGPMLAKPTNGVTEVLDRLSGKVFTCEWKYDGERGQIHFMPDGSTRIFSRNAEDNTSKYPDLIQMLPTAMRPGAVTSCVLDGEVVAYDRTTNAILPFQVLSTRARKGVALEEIKVQVLYVAFDVLFLNGESCMQKTLRQRRELLETLFNPVPGKFQFATHFESSDTEEIMSFLNDSIKGNCEGLMVKTLDENATYEPARRSLNWLKLKKDYMDSITDTLDLVPIAAWYGQGKRTGTFGAYLLACYDDEAETFQSITKIGTGFTDEQLASLTAFFKEKELLMDKPEYNVLASGQREEPDVWLKPATVWEVKAADLSISPVSQAAMGLVDPHKGIALRFPRYLRTREDKGVEHATTAEQVAQMYRDQGLAAANGGAGAAEEEDDYL